MLAERRTKNATLSFSTKAETLERVSSYLTSATVLPLFYFSASDWQYKKETVLALLSSQPWHNQPLIVRSSAGNEDTLESSNAGNFNSLLNIYFNTNLVSAVDEVISSYDDRHDQNQILIQPMLNEVAISGVVFSNDPNTHAPYRIINYDDSTGDTTTVTSGSQNQKCLIISRATPSTPEQFIPVIAMVNELEQLFNHANLDIEFAITHHNELFLFQVRPLISHNIYHPYDETNHKNLLHRIQDKINLGFTNHPYLYGNKTVYGVMPDWNPAEIIGIRPKTLAISLYRDLITDAVWAYQRSNYGYKNLRSFPLLVDFEGLPYIDVRVSFNSFLPNNLPDDLCEKLVNFYIDQLTSAPHLHDKVEFDIVYSCYTLDLSIRLKKLIHHGFSDSEQTIIQESLTQLTNQIINNKDGLWKQDLSKIEELSLRQERISKSMLDPISKIYWLIEDCKRYGTLPFAGLARAGFIAVQILKSFVAVGILTSDDYTNFIASVNSVSSMMTEELRTLSKSDFLEKYGHLRPGTYDILSYRYDEKPDFYFDWNEKSNQAQTSHATFSLTIDQLRKIQAHIDQDNLHINVLELLEFIKTAIEAREYSKFIFTRSVSDTLKLIETYANQFGIPREDCAYLNINSILSLYSTTRDSKQLFTECIERGKKQYKISCSIQLPPLITNQNQVFHFELPNTTPNFITQKTASGHCTTPNTPRDQLTHSIMFIPSADPGYDWIFSTGIAGFITQYGGVNSHMAIRAGELGLPAIIGCGNLNFDRWSKSKHIQMDCANQQVHCL